MDRDGILSLALELFPYPNVYSQQKDFMKRMIDVFAEGKVGLFESPTGTVHEVSTALAFQALESQYELEKENSLFDEPDWIKQGRKKLKPTVRQSTKPVWKSRKKSKKEPAVDDSDLNIASLLGKLLDADEEELVDEVLSRRKIYFCSRTHSQLSQAMGELSKILAKAKESDTLDLEAFTSVTLGSRVNLCVNKDVSKLSSISRINEKCLDLQVESEGSCCPFYNEDMEPSMDLLVDAMKRLHVADIEDMHKLGKEVSACSYYAARRLQESANFVTIPYNALLQKETREAFGIDIEGSIVIIDEAHNLLDAINGIHTAALSAESVEKAQRALVLYNDRYGRRLSPLHVQMIQQLIQAMAQMIAFAAEIKNSYVAKINSFLHSCKIDNINVLPIAVYARESHLSQKISSFYETTSEGKDSNLLNEVIRFLELLTNSDGDGRVFVQADPVRFKYLSLNPEGYFAEVLSSAHSVMLAGGTMSPCEDYIDQLFGLSSSRDRIVQFSCDHLIPQDNCLAIALSSGPSNVSFDFSFNHRNDPALIQELGQTIINLTNITPDGIVCFFPSYAYLRQIIEVWTSSGIITSIESKKKVVVESSSETNVESIIQSFREGVLHTRSNGAILFGVMGGRLSEGINFSDRLARLVVVVGMPFPNVNDPETAERVGHYLRRKAATNTKISPDLARSQYLENICMRSVNQTLGRVIRHRDDWAAMILIDKRYMQPRIAPKLSGWVRRSLQDTSSFGQAFSAVSMGIDASSSVRFPDSDSPSMDLSRFNVSLIALLKSEDGAQEASNGTEKIDQLLVYFGSIYLALVVLNALLPTQVIAVIVILLMCAAFIMPSDHFGLNYRYAFIGCLRRVLLNSWKAPTKFSELILADIMTSFAKIFADWDALLRCYLIVPFYNPGGSGSYSCAPSWLSVFLVCLPYYIRFRQSVGDYWSSGQPRHAINGVKYFTSFPVIYLSFLVGGSQSHTNLHYYWIGALSVNFIISCVWDVLMDWDLGYSSSHESLLARQEFPWRLRPSLLFSGSPLLYYLSAYFNCLIRGAWIFRIYFIVSGNLELVRLMDSQAGLFILQLLEITRRFVWLWFRAEAQTLQGAGKRLPQFSSNVNLSEIEDS